MAKTTKKKVSRIKVKKKTWFKIISPKLFGSKEIGETYLSTIDKAVGRIFEVNLRDLTNSVKDQNTYITFKVINADGSALKTKTVGYNLASSFVKRLVKKGTSRMDDYNLFKTKTGENVIVKSLIIARNQTQRSTKTLLRQKMKEVLEEEIKRNDLDSFVSNLVSYKFQSGLKKKLSKIFPVKEATVRVLKLNKGKNEPVEKEIKVADVKEVPKEQSKVSEESKEEIKEESPEEKTVEEDIPEATEEKKTAEA